MICNNIYNNNINNFPKNNIMKIKINGQNINNNY